MKFSLSSPKGQSSIRRNRYIYFFQSESLSQGNTKGTAADGNILRG